MKQPIILTDEFELPAVYLSRKPLILISIKGIIGDVKKLTENFPDYFSDKDEELWEKFIKDVQSLKIDRNMSELWAECKSLRFRARLLIYYIFDYDLVQAALPWGKVVEWNSCSVWNHLVQHDYIDDPDCCQPLGNRKKEPEDMFFIEDLPDELMDFLIRLITISREWTLDKYSFKGEEALGAMIRLFDRAIISILELSEGNRLTLEQSCRLLDAYVFNSKSFDSGGRHDRKQMDGMESIMNNPKISSCIKQQADAIVRTQSINEQNKHVRSKIDACYKQIFEESLAPGGCVEGFDDDYFLGLLSYIRNKTNKYPFSPETTQRLFHRLENYPLLMIEILRDYIDREHSHFYNNYPERARLVIRNKEVADEWLKVKIFLERHEDLDSANFVNPLTEEIDKALEWWRKIQEENERNEALFQKYIGTMNQSA